MRIGVDAACWANGRGYGRYARELLRAMVTLAPDDQFVFFLDDHAARTFDLREANVKVVHVPQHVSPTLAAAANGSRSPSDMLRFSRAVWREPLDVFFSPSVYSYFPLPPRLAAVITIHDTIAERFPELTLPSPRARLFWRMKVGLALKQARLVLTPSDFSSREVSEVLGVPEERIRVAGEAPASAFRPSECESQIREAAGRMGLPIGARWFAYVGGFNPHKNVDVIVRAHARIAAECSASEAPYLLLIGATTGDVFHGDHARIKDAIACSGTDALVRWAGWVADEELRHLLTGAAALLLPSECEGFGLPAVEAAACGTPVIATLASPLPELLAGGGIFVQPRDEDALTNAMRALLGDRSARYAFGARARERALELTWERGAAAALGALREAAA
ncbi:MAG: glycosyltransferase family 4 protein [Anaerolineae bacterium]|nr:glycosyltransferase family 4 protein [Gemmatimonadaceae bacterium]